MSWSANHFHVLLTEFLGSRIGHVGLHSFQIIDLQPN
jgi:hypothetical protein